MHAAEKTTVPNWKLLFTFACVATTVTRMPLIPPAKTDHIAYTWCRPHLLSAIYMPKKKGEWLCALCLLFLA